MKKLFIAQQDGLYVLKNRDTGYELEVYKTSEEAEDGLREAIKYGYYK